MADFLSRLIVDNSAYVKGLKDARKVLLGFGEDNKNFAKISENASAFTNRFNDSINKNTNIAKKAGGILGKVGGVISKYGGYIAGSLSAGYAFNEMMKNSQFFGDKVTVAMNTAKDSVNEFFYSLGTGDFSSFITGIEDIISKSASATALLDQLGNTQMSYSFVRMENNRELATAKTVANNKELDKNSREKAFGDWKIALEKSYNYANNLERDTHAAIKALSIANTSLKGVTIDDIKKIIRLDIQNPDYRDKEKNRLNQEYDSYKAQKNALAHGDHASVWNSKGLRTYEQQLDDLAEKYSEAILFNNLLNKKNDEAWKDIIDKMIEADSATEELGSKTEEYNNALREFHTALKGTPKAIVPEGSIAEIEAKIKDASKLYAEATSDAARIAAQKTLKELNAKKSRLDFISKHPVSPAPVERNRSSFISMIPPAGTSKLSKLETLDVKPQIEDMEAYTDSILNCITAFGSLGSAFSNQAGEAFNYFANIISGAAQAAVAISALIPIKREEANVSMKAATAGAMSSVSSIPFVGPAMAVAAVAQLLAAMAAVPSFANGGIVPGSNFRDGIRANVSSGEMFINQHDQSKLFKAIKSGDFGSNNSQPYVSGEQIYLGLKNYMNRTGKKTIIK